MPWRLSVSRRDVVVLGTQVTRQLPVKRLADMGHPAMHAGQMGFGLSAVLRARHFWILHGWPVPLAERLLERLGACRSLPSLPVR